MAGIVLNVCTLIGGSVLLGYQYGWRVGAAVFALAVFIKCEGH